MTEYNQYGRLEKRIAELARELKELQQAPRATRTSIDRGGIRLIGDGSIYAQDDNGAETLRIGEQWDGTFMAAPLGGPTPPTPSKPIVTPVTGGLEIEWDGGWEGGAYTPMDFSRIEVHISLQAQFEAVPATLIGTIETPQGANIQRNLPYVQHYVKFVARSLSGKASLPSDFSYGTPLTITPDDLDFDLEEIRGTTIFYGEDPPLDPKRDDLWLKQPENILYRYSYDEDAYALGNFVLTWQESRDEGVTQAVIDAGNAQIIAQSKSRVFSQPTAPTGMTIDDTGDLWMDSDAGNRLYSWDGDSWEPRPLGNLAIQPNSLVASDVVALGTISGPLLQADSITASKLAIGTLQTSLLKNAGFEDTGETTPTPGVKVAVPNWTLTNGGDSSGENFRYAQESLGFPGRSGLCIALLSNDGTGPNGSRLYQDMPVSSGSAYRASAYIRLYSGATNQKVVLRVWSSTNGTTFTTSQGSTVGTVSGTSWVEVAIQTASLAAGITHLRFEVTHVGQNTGAGGAGFLFLDDAALVRVGSPAVEITSSGVRMWNSSGVETISLSGGSSRIVGGILATAISGKRVEISAANSDRITWQSGDPAQTTPGAVAVGVSDPTYTFPGRQGYLDLTPPQLGGATVDREPRISLYSATPAGSLGSIIVQGQIELQYPRSTMSIGGGSASGRVYYTTNQLPNGTVIGSIGFPEMIYDSTVRCIVNGTGGFAGGPVDFTIGFNISTGGTVDGTVNQFVTAQAAKWAALGSMCSFVVPKNIAVTLFMTSQVAGGESAYYRLGLDWTRSTGL